MRREQDLRRLRELSKHPHHVLDASRVKPVLGLLHEEDAVGLR
jgi:hypothetical protein